MIRGPIPGQTFPAKRGHVRVKRVESRGHLVIYEKVGRAGPEMRLTIESFRRAFMENRGRGDSVEKTTKGKVLKMAEITSKKVAEIAAFVLQLDDAEIVDIVMQRREICGHDCFDAIRAIAGSALTQREPEEGG